MKGPGARVDQASGPRKGSRVTLSSDRHLLFLREFVNVAAHQPHYSPKQIAEAMSVSESSVKRWCDREIIPSVKTLGGHRRITLEGLHRFLRESGRELIRPELLGLAALPVNRRPQIRGTDDPLQKSFRNSLARGDESECRILLRRRIKAGWSRWEAAEDLITDAMQGFGDAWDCNQLVVYQERRGCEIAMRLIYELRGELTPPAPQAPIAIGGTPEGDPYQLPTALVELALREVGWQATSLGCGLPLGSFLQAARDYRPDLVWLSVSSIADEASFVAAERELADSLGDKTPLLVGGRALSDDVRPQLHYTAHCDSLRHLVDLAALIRHHQPARV